MFMVLYLTFFFILLPIRDYLERNAYFLNLQFESYDKFMQNCHFIK